MSGRECGMDIGAGNLRHSRMLVNEFGFQKVIAIDIDPIVHDGLEREIEIRRMNAKKLRIPPVSQDVIIMWALSHFLPRGQIRGLLEQIRLGLRSGGCFFGTFTTYLPGLNLPVTSFPQEKIEAALKGLATAVVPTPFAEDHPMAHVPGAAMLLVMACKE